MSSINPHFTLNYSQPEDYRFSHDSVFLARRVYELIRDEDISTWRGLDLCSGCGVIGLDLLFHCHKEANKTFAAFDFLEVQDIYASHFATNVERLGDIGAELNFVNQNYNVLASAAWENKFDVIVCNPPYFHLGQGKLSPSEFKNRCRFFMDSDFKSLFKGLINTLKPGSHAYVLLRDQVEHGWSATEEARKCIAALGSLESLEDIRGTGVVRITKFPQKI